MPPAERFRPSKPSDARLSADSRIALATSSDRTRFAARSPCPNPPTIQSSFACKSPEAAANFAQTLTSSSSSSDPSEPLSLSTPTLRISRARCADARARSAEAFARAISWLRRSSRFACVTAAAALSDQIPATAARHSALSSKTQLSFTGRPECKQDLPERFVCLLTRRSVSSTLRGTFPAGRRRMTGAGRGRLGSAGGATLLTLGSRLVPAEATSAQLPATVGQQAWLDKMLAEMTE